MSHPKPTPVRRARHPEGAVDRHLIGDALKLRPKKFSYGHIRVATLQNGSRISDMQDIVSDVDDGVVILLEVRPMPMLTAASTEVHLQTSCLMEYGMFDSETVPNGRPVDRTSGAPSDPTVKEAKLYGLAQSARDRCVRLGWSQAELARRARLNRNVINTLENRVSFPFRHNVVRIAEALGVAVSHLTDVFVHEDLQRAPASLSMTEAMGQPNVVLLQVHRRVATATAAKVLALLSEDASGLA